MVLIKKLKSVEYMKIENLNICPQNCKFRDIKIENDKFKKGSEDKDCKMFLNKIIIIILLEQIYY